MNRTFRRFWELKNPISLRKQVSSVYRNSTGKTVEVIMPINLWRDIEFESKTAYLLAN